MLGSNEVINLVSLEGKVLDTFFVNVYGIIHGLDVGTKIGCLDVSFDGSNDGKLDILLI